MLKMRRHSHARMGGYTLIELMVALVVGLIVSGAAIAFVVSIMKSNSETIRATRLTQELRVTAEIISRELRRARSVTDPIANVGLANASLLKACNTITPATSGTTATCATFGYDCNSAGDAVFKAIGLAGGKVRLVSATAAVPTCPTTATGTQLSSDAVNITDMTVCAGTFDGSGTCASSSTDVYTVRLRGSFNSDPAGLVRSFSQEVRIRSTVVN